MKISAGSSGPRRRQPSARLTPGVLRLPDLADPLGSAS